MSFVHLHCHSEYSLLDGANRISDLIQQAQEFEQPALALTDHGVMYGAWTFQEKAKKAGLKPIVGMEAYVAPGSRFDRTKVKGEKGYYHLVLLARDYQGYRNLAKLTSLGHTEGFYFKPRLDREILERHGEGLIVSSACLAGEVAQHLMEDRWSEAEEAAAWYADVFQDRYYLEVQAHDSEGQDELNRRIFALAEKLNLPVVATNDAHFLKAGDHGAHDTLLCIGLGKDKNDPERMHYDEGLYFKSHLEMAERFPGRADVLENTLKIADECNFTYPKGYHVPAFPVQDEGFASEEEMLAHWVWTGARAHYAPESDGNAAPQAVLPQEIRERVEYELEVITKLGYAGYFLITADFIRWAREHDIPVGPGRGSAAGSIVAYCMGITDCCPIKFDLLFERFLNPERVSMPDIDVDFCFERRGEVIEYVREKYGRDAVGQIITFGTMKSRAVVKDVGRTLGFAPAETDRLAKMIPNGPGYSLTVAEAIEKIDDVRQLYENDDRYRRLLDDSKTLEGLSRHSSVHAAGVVIAPGPIDEYVPVCTQSTKGSGVSGEDQVVVTQYDMNALEKAGMLKMDFLGLKTLTVIFDAVQTIRARHGALRHPTDGVEYNRPENIPLDDPGVFRMLARGGTAGVFQFESNLATEKLRQMKADRFDDLVAANALLRPGPLDMGMDEIYIKRKLGQQEVAFPFDELAEVLEPTYGVIVYQEQVMRTAQILAGHSLAEADVLRKAVGKKDADLIKLELGKFVEKAVQKGYDRQRITGLAEQIEAFGRYGFNKSHSAAYSLVAYQTAWLKAHYPAEFMAALMSSVVDKTDDVVAYIAACRELGKSLPEKCPGGLEVLPPHVNESNWKFTVVGDGVGQIRFGLGAIRGVGEGAVRSILAARVTEGPFTGLFDFLCRIDLRLCNKRVVEALILAGALDGFAPEGRAQLLAALDTTMASAQAVHRERESAQADIFGGGDAGGTSIPEPPLPNVLRWSEGERLQREKEILGFFISGHPLDRYRDDMSLFSDVHTGNLKEFRGQRVEIACVVTEAARQVSKRDGSEWGRITVEDFHGTATVLAFNKTWAEWKHLLTQDQPLLLRGGVSDRERDEDDPPLFLNDAILLSDVRNLGGIGVEVDLDAGALTTDQIAEAKQCFALHPGEGSLCLLWTHPGEPTAIRLQSRSISVSPSDGLLAQLREILGPHRVRLTRTINPEANDIRRT